MEEEKIAEFCKSDPNGTKEEASFSISFTKDMKMASVSSTIKGTSLGLLRHSDVNVTQISTLDTEEMIYRDMAPEDFEGGDNMIVWGVSGKFPIESLKIQSNPRSARSYAKIISSQSGVTFKDIENR